MCKLGLTLGLASFALLGGCGGGGSGGGTVTVAPGGTPTPTSSTPTPTPAGGGLNTGEIKPTPDATFIAATMEMTTSAGTSSTLTGGTTGGSTSNRSTVLDTPGFTASYSSTTGYRLADAASNVSFGPAQLTSDTTATDKFYPTVLFTNPATSTVDYLALYRELVTTSSILGSGSATPKFGGIGGWQHTIMDPGSHRTRLDYFAFGPVTPLTAMPRSGVVKFTLMGSGNYAGDTDLWFTTHADTVTVDFSAGTISGMITAGGHNFYTGGFGGLYGLTLAGTITGNAVTGPTGSSVAVASGQFHLLFVGPNADELIVTYAGQDGRGSYVGSSVGVRNPYLP